MGASSWCTTVPYTEDIVAALEQARWEVFSDGAYYDTARSDPFDPTEDVVDYASPDEVLHAQGETGTHSVIDMYRGVDERPGFGTVSPLDEQQLQYIFGTPRPAAKCVQMWSTTGDIGAYRARWEGMYIVTYTAGKPREICFTGYSGD